MTDSVSMDPFSFWEYQQGYDISRLSDEKREKKITQGAVDFEQLEKSAAETSTEFFVSLKNDIEDAIEKFAALSEVMDKVTGEPQPTSNIKQALEVSLAAVNHRGVHLKHQQRRFDHRYPCHQRDESRVRPIMANVIQLDRKCRSSSSQSCLGSVPSANQQHYRPIISRALCV